MRRVSLPLLFAFIACTPPAPKELQIPTVASLQGKSYEEMVEATKIEASLGAEILEVRLITPEIASKYVEVYGKAQNFSEEEMEFHKASVMKRDEVTCQVFFKAVSENGAMPNNWKYTLTDDQGKTVVGKAIFQENARPIRGAIGATGQTTYQMGAQIVFDGYQIGNAKKITVNFAREGGNSIDLTWLLHADHVPPAGTEPASEPASEPVSEPAAAPEASL